jgi:hypothetical protein
VLKVNLAAEKLAREQRIKMLAQEKLKDAAMPGSMQQDLDRRVNQKEKPLSAEYTFKPQITKAMTKEDFE